MDLINVLWKNKLNHWEYDLEKLIDLIEKLSEECSGKGQLCEKLGVYADFLDRLEKIHNIKINYNFILEKNNSKFKAIYQNYDWCYQKYFIEGLNHEEMAKEANCSKRVIEKWCVEKHRLTTEYRMNNKKLNKTQQDLLIGSMLGDGHIDKRETQPIFIVSHAQNQKDYLYWKYEILKDLCNIPPTEKEECVRSFNGKDYLCQKNYRLCTRIHKCLIKYRSATNSELLNKLNEFSLSIWVLDDGCRKDSNWELCVAEYTQEEITLTINILKDRFNLTAYSKKDKRYLDLNADSSRRLDDIIIKNIPNNLDIIKYKITNNDGIKKAQKRVYINVNNEKILLSDYCKNNNLNYRRVINRTYKGVNVYDSINMEETI